MSQGPSAFQGCPTTPPSAPRIGVHMDRAWGDPSSEATVAQHRSL